MAYAIRRFCDIVRPPGGRLKTRIGFFCWRPKAWSPKPQAFLKLIRVHPANKKNKKSTERRLPGFGLLAKLADERPGPAKVSQSQSNLVKIKSQPGEREQHFGVRGHDRALELDDM